MRIDETIKGYSHLLKRESSPKHIGELLIERILGKDKPWVIAHMDFELSENEVSKFVDLAERYANGEPLAYIFNTKEFYGLDFYIDKRVLVPRPETEFLVELAVDFVQKKCTKVDPVIIDVGTGSGCIAVAIGASIYKDFPDAKIVGFDISKDALDVALINVKQHSMEDVVELVESDLLSNLSIQNLDLMVANLPYIGVVTNRFVDEFTEKFEPELALFGGDSGLELYQKMFQQILDKEIQFSLMIGEFCFGQGEEVRSLLSKYFDHKFRIEKDLAGVERYFVVDFC